MKLAGLQKLTLLDDPGHVACTVFVQGCNFRCPFCHNSELIPRNTDALCPVSYTHLMTTEDFNDLMAQAISVQPISEG